MNKKRIFRVTIEETISQTFEVLAESFEDAEEITTEKYNNGEFVLEPGELQHKEMMINDVENNEETNFFEF